MTNLGSQVLKLKEENKLLKKELKQYKKAYSEMFCYFDSISDEEQELLVKRLNRIFKLK